MIGDSAAGIYHSARLSTASLPTSMSTALFMLREVKRCAWSVENAPRTVAAPNTQRSGGVHVDCIHWNYPASALSSSSSVFGPKFRHRRGAVRPWGLTLVTCCAALLSFDRNNDQRCVVVEGAAGKCCDVGGETRFECGCAASAAGDGAGEQTVLAVFVVGCVARLGHAVGEENDAISGRDHGLPFSVGRDGEHTEDGPAFDEPLAPTVRAHEHRCVMAGVAVGEGAERGVHEAVKEADEASFGDVAAQDVVDERYQFRRTRGL